MDAGFQWATSPPGRFFGSEMGIKTGIFTHCGNLCKPEKCGPSDSFIHKSGSPDTHFFSNILFIVNNQIVRVIFLFFYTFGKTIQYALRNQTRERFPVH